MINKIILISAVRVLENDLNRFDINKYTSNIEFQIWDLSHFIYRKKINNLKINKNYKINEILKIFKSEQEFIGDLMNLNEYSLIIDLFEIIFTKKYQKIIFRNRIKTMKFNLGPIPPIHRNFFAKLYEFWNNNSYYIKTLFKRYLLNNYFAPNYYVCVSKLDIPFYVNSKTKIIQTHSFDFDKILKRKKSKINIKHKNKKLAVYIDEGVYGHPDFSYNNLKDYCNEKIFFKEIHNFFDYLKNNNYDVIIAGHPKIHYSKKIKKLFKFKIIEGSTNELICNSDLVLTHMSTSINFAILHKKKILHLDSSSYNQRLRDHIITFSNYIGSQIVDLNDIKYQYFFDKINNKNFNKYENRFITPFKNKNKKLWQIVLEKIQLGL